MMNILSLNVAHALLKNELVAYITQHVANTSVFCFQETDEATRELITNTLPDDFVAYHQKKKTEAATYLVSTYVRQNNTVLDTHAPLQNIANAGTSLSVTIQTEQGSIITVSNVHGAPYPGHKLDTPERLAQTHGLLAFAEEHVGTHVFIGDFNLLPETESVQAFSKQGFDDLIKSFAVPTTRNNLAWDKYPGSKQLFADYAFVRSDKPIEYDFAVDTEIVSDHQPMRLNLRFNELSIEKIAIDTSVKIVQQM